MPTVSVNLTTSEYVQVNTGFNPMVLQAHNDSVRVVLSALKPAKTNPVFHILGGGDAPLYFSSIDTNVWALAISNDSSLIVSETNSIPVTVYSDADVAAYIDTFGGAVGTIEQEHLKIHKGEAFTFSERLNITEGGGVHDVLFDVPDLVYPHLRRVYVTSTDATDVNVDLYGNVVTSVNGIEKTSVMNNNQNSSNTPGVTIYNSPTVTDLGDLLESFDFSSTKKESSSGTGGINEWDIKTNSKALVRVTNNTPGAGTSSFIVNLFWYE